MKFMKFNHYLLAILMFGSITFSLSSCGEDEPVDPPIVETTTVVDIIVNSEDHTNLEDALVATDLIGVLNGEGPFTVFAPTDDAHMALMAALGITLEELMATDHVQTISEIQNNKFKKIAQLDVKIAQ